MTKDPDAYAIWGDWDLENFKIQIARWRDGTHPPADVFDHINRWWPLLKQPLERSGAARISPEHDPRRNLWWMWVPGGKWLDEHGNFFRVQCYYRVHERDNPPRVVCEEFRTVRSLSPAEVDRAEGMG